MSVSSVSTLYEQRQTQKKDLTKEVEQTIEKRLKERQVQE